MPTKIAKPTPCNVTKDFVVQCVRLSRAKNKHSYYDIAEDLNSWNYTYNDKPFTVAILREILNDQQKNQL